MDQQLSDLTALAAVVAGAALLYAKTLGKTQMQVSQWIILAFAVQSRFKGLINLLCGVLLALILSALAVWQTREWLIFGIGIPAGIMASVEAAKAHDEAPEPEPTGRPPPPEAFTQ